MSLPLSSNENNQQGQPIWLDKFITIYSQLSVDNLTLLEELYHSDVNFIDPMHSLQGLEPLKKYLTTYTVTLLAVSLL